MSRAGTFQIRVNICCEELMNRKMKIPMLSFQRESDGINLSPFSYRTLGKWKIVK